MDSASVDQDIRPAGAAVPDSVLPIGGLLAPVVDSAENTSFVEHKSVCDWMSWR